MSSNAEKHATSMPLRVLCAVALQPAMPDLATAFAVRCGHEVKVSYDFNPAVAHRIEQGEGFDVAITNPHLLDRLGASGHIDPCSVVSFGRSRLGIGMRRGHPELDLTCPEAVCGTLSAVESIGYGADGTSGCVFRELLQQLGMINALAGKLHAMSGGDAGRAVARGEVEICVVPVSTILAAAPEAVLAGTFPGDLDRCIDFATGLAANRRIHAAATVFLAYLSEAAHDAALARKGIVRIGRDRSV
jgi:molybdate transport system substrate-binding protein